MSSIELPPPPEPPERQPGPLGDHARRRLRERLYSTNPTAFNNPEIRQFYVDFFEAMCTELEGVPGYGIAMEAIAERYSFLLAQMKAFDVQETPLDPLHYEKLIQRFTMLFDRLLKGRDERSADESFKRQFMGSLINSVVEAIETAVPDRDEALRIQAAIASHLRKANADPAVAQRSA